MDDLVVGHGRRDDIARHLGADHGDVAADISVFRVFHEASVIPPVPAVGGSPDAGDDGHTGNDPHPAAQPMSLFWHGGRNWFSYRLRHGDYSFNIFPGSG